ncbi:MAG: glycosyltransferase family 4 protein, partial [Pseudomonadota bacterium]
DPARVSAGRAAARKLSGFAGAKSAYEADLARERSASRRRRWGQAAVLAAELPQSVRFIYVHYLHTPASVARYAALMRGLPFGFSAHAKDIYTTQPWELAEKIADARWGVTCTRHNAAFLRALSDDPAKVRLVYHGLDPEPFYLPHRPASGTVKIVSVCRAVEKKGIDDLLRALAKLPSATDWKLEHIGGGNLERYRTLAARLGIAQRVTFRGPRTRSEVIEAYARADVFALACRVARNGDRDGLPNVIMEAMAMGLPVVSTEVSAVPEIVDETTGILVPQRDPAALSAALQKLCEEPLLRTALGKAGQARVLADFSPYPGFETIAALLAQEAPAKAAA